MIIRSSRLLLLFFAAALVGLALIFGALVFQLSWGPISLRFLTPLIEQALATRQSAVQVRLHDTILTWEESERALDIRAVGLQFLDRDGGVQVTIPEMSVKFSASALLRGLVAPTSLDLFGPRIRIVRAQDGSVSLGLGDKAGGDAAQASPMGLVRELLQPPNPELASGYLARVGVRSAFIEYLDFARGIQLTAPAANIALLRDAAGIIAEGSVVIGERDAILRADLSGAYRVQSGATDLGIVFDDVTPTALVQLDPAFEQLARLDASLEGTIALSLDSALEPTSVTVDIRSGGGAIDAAPLFEAPLPFDAAVLKGRTVRGLEAFEVEELSLAVGAARFAVSGAADRIGAIWSLNVNGSIEQFPANAIGDYWPETVEPSTREWITGNIRDGIVERATIGVQAEVPEAEPGAYSLASVGGEIHFRDVTVHYFRPLEPGRDVRGVARFDARRFTVDIEGGAFDENVVETGRVEIEGLDGPARGESIKIQVTVSGAVREALEILDSEPLGFVSKFGIDPARTKGQQRTNAVFAFPLLNEVTVDEIAVATASRLTGFAAEAAAFGLPVSDGDLTLSIDREGMEAKGTASIAAIPVGLTWSERFERDGDVRTRYEVRTNLDAQARDALGLSAAPFVSGTLELGLTYALGWDGMAAGAAEIDLTDAELALDPFQWRKPPGESGRAFLRFIVQDDVLVSVPELTISADDLDISGSVLFRRGADGPEPQRVSLPRVAFGGNDVFANIELPAGVPPIISIGGRAIDLRPFMDDVLGGGEDGGDPTPAMQIVISEQSPLQEVRLGEQTRLLGLHGTLINDGADWSNVRLRARISGAGRMFLEIAPEDQIRRVMFESDDAGGVLRALDWIDTIRGGEMRVLATISDGAKQKIAGQLDMQNFLLADGLIGAQILSLASLTGIADLLRGEGLSFRRAEVPFEITDDEIQIRNAKARGADVGIIATGTIDRASDTLNMSGEIAPAYTLNSILANIPLIGTVLSGGSDGIFAATFTARGPLEDPDVSVNPLAVLTPGIVRRILTGFGQDDAPPDSEPPAESESEPVPGAGQ